MLGHGHYVPAGDLQRRGVRARGQDEADVVGAHLQAATSLSALQATARDRKNVFAALMEAVKMHSLGQISHALYEVGGEYRRNM
jgi:methylmalonyl-CoA mutase